MTLSKKAIINIHRCIVFVGGSVCTFLVGVLTNGVPTNKAAWHSLWGGLGAAAFSAFFGWLGRFLPTTLPPGEEP